jgi:hypothetical protein
MLSVYYMINTQASVGAAENTSSIDSITYRQILSKLFIVSVLGTRLLGVKEIFFRSSGTKDLGVSVERPWLRNQL